MQNKLNDISEWTKQNLMLLNESKCNYIIYTRSKEEFSTRLTMNGVILQRVSAVKLLGVWLDEDMSWETNTKQICIKAFSRVSMLSKLKFAGINRSDLLTIYKLFIRSVTEYCCVVFHTSLTEKQCKKIEVIQKASLKIILDKDYINYESALNMCSIDTLANRRQERMEKFSLKCINDKFNNKIFPTNKIPNNREAYEVNFARTNKYLKSAVPQCQRILNKLAKSQST